MLINDAIRAKELRVISENGENLGVISREEALKRAQEAALDLIEISANSNPPVAKIMDYGKFRYEQKKKERVQKAKSSTTETKSVQVKIGTGEHDLELKAKRASEWLKEGDRVKVELYLKGRSKFMEKDFLEDRLNRFLKLISTDHKVAEAPKKGPKGLYMILEKK